MAEKEKEGMSKTTKIVIVVVVVLLIVIAVWYLFKGSATGNKYASADSIAKAKSGQFGKWSDPSDPTWYNLLTKVIELFGAGGHNYGPLPNSDNQAYASAWLKGMNLARVPANLVEFKSDIQKYINSSFKKPDWEITSVGSFLTDKSAATA